MQPEAWQIVQLANQARAALGAGPLQWDPALGTAARQHCLRMAAEGPISHQYSGEPDVEHRAGQAGAHFSLIEENVAFGQTPAEIHSAWMHSPDHRSNLLNPDVNRVGVAIVAGRKGLYAVADYEREVPMLSRAQVESSIVGLLRDRGVKVLQDSGDARTACARGNKPDSGRRPGFFMLWQGADVNQLPGALTDRISTGRYRQAEVGSCPAQVAGNTFSAYRVAVLLY